MMRLGRFRLGRFFSWLSLGLEPFGVEDAGLINALVRVCAEEIALRLQEICRKASGAITIEVRQRGGKRGDGYAMLDSNRNNKSPFRLRSFDDPCEIPIEQKIVQIAVALISLNDAVQEFRANDAAAPPDCGDVAQIQVPFVGGASGAKELHSLRVRNDFRRIESIAHAVDA